VTFILKAARARRISGTGSMLKRFPHEEALKTLNPVEKYLDHLFFLISKNLFAFVVSSMAQFFTTAIFIRFNRKKVYS